MFFFILALVVLLNCYQVSAQSFNETLTSYDNIQAQKSVWLSASAYCSPDTYTTRSFKGPISGSLEFIQDDNFIIDLKCLFYFKILGFTASYKISTVLADTAGYVGVLPSDKSIYVVFRGSSSIRNWVTNLDAFKTKYTTYSECNCEVHKGFYNAALSVAPGIINHIKLLRTQNPVSYIV